MEVNKRIKEETSYIELGICFRQLQIIGAKLLVPKSQERIFMLVQRRKIGMKGYDMNMKAGEKHKCMGGTTWRNLGTEHRREHSIQNRH